MNKKTVKYIINVLRQSTITWPERTDCLKRGRKKILAGKKKNGSDKYLWGHCCDECGKWFLMKDSMLEVDHKIPVGPFNNDWDDFINRLFCEPDNLQKLCRPCHLIKTSLGNAQLRYQRKNFRAEDYL